MQTTTEFDSSISRLINVIGSEDFGDGFFSAMDSVIPIDHCTVFVSERDEITPLVAQAHCAQARRKVQTLARSYVLTGHRRDPIWKSAINNGMNVPTVVMPSALHDAAYRRELYDTPNVFEEIAHCGQRDGRLVYVAYYREKQKGHFNETEIDRLAACGQAVMSVLAKQADISRRLGGQVTRPQPLSRDELLKKVHSVILEDVPQLTQREAEICAGIILGYTVLGLSLNLGISVNTVATHRKRAYAKLKISSQNELFTHYFGLVERLNH